MDMISFPCSHCGTVLKVRAAIKNSIINCPKCGKKTSASSPSPAQAPKPVNVAPSAPPVIKSTPPPPSSPVPPEETFELVTEDETPAPAPASATPTPLAPATQPAPDPAPSQPAFTPAPPAQPPSPAPVIEYVQDPALSERLRKLEMELEVARLKTEQAELARQQILAAKTADRTALEKKAEDHFKTELEAAKKTIAEQDDKLAAEYRRRVEAEALAKNKRGATEIERDLLKTGATVTDDEDTIDPDAIMAEIKYSTLGKDLRTSLLIHTLIMGLTSIGYIVTLIRGPQEPPPPPEKPAVTAPAGKKAATTETKQEPAKGKPAPAAVETEKPKAPVAGEAGTAETKGKTVIEKKIEELPAKGEAAPKDTSVTLNLD